MEHKLVKTDNYLLVVSDERIEDLRPLKDRWHLEQGSILNKFPTYLTDLVECKLVLAHLPLNNSPYLDGVDVLPPLEDNVDKDLFYNKQVMNPYSTGTQSYSSYEKGFIEGYSKAKEKYKYTEEDVVKLIHSWDMHINQKEEDKGCLRLIYEHIQSLNQPTLPIAFECEMEQLNNKHGSSYSTKTLYKPKTITNSQGRTEWVGEYKF